ncbi:MAG TPA: PilZ domain-containing protein [Planctomycetaceae bacterium]|nr:PilZ domain-containing protein [Planctomycetaceae bacterium]
MPSPQDRTSPRPLIVESERLHSAIVTVRNACVPPADRQPLSFDAPEARAGTRIVLDVPIRITAATVDSQTVELLNHPLPGKAIDLSLGGLAFVHGERLERSDTCVVTFALPGLEPISLVVKLLWTADDPHSGFRSGGRFVGMI